jgi:membrane protein DedA with SNARE-associated domain
VELLLPIIAEQNAVMAWLQNFLSSHGPIILYTGTFLILVICGLGVPFPEEATFLVAGYACAKTAGASVELLCVIGVLGIMIGDSFPFWFGRKKGMSILKYKYIAKLLPPHRIEQVKKFFEKQGAKTVFVARFVAGLRMPTFFMAGTMGIKYRVFFFYDLLGALISCPTSIWLAWKFGEDAERLIKENHIYLFLFLGLIIGYIIFHVVTHREKTPPPVPADGAVPTLENAAAQQSAPLPAKTPEVQP